MMDSRDEWIVQGSGIRDAGLADAAALHDPLIVGVDHLLQIGVRQDPLGRVGADPRDPRSRHSRPPSRPPRASSSPSPALISSFTPAPAHSCAPLTAFLMAFSVDAP